MFSSAESYYDYANCTEEFFGRKADHPRGFLFLRAFSNNFDGYTTLFDNTSLFESHFRRDGDIPSLAMKKVADYAAPDGAMAIYDPAALERFRRNRFLNPAATTPEEAVKNFPQEKKVPNMPFRAAETDTLQKGGLTEKFNALGADKDLSPRIVKQFRKIMVKPN